MGTLILGSMVRFLPGPNLKNLKICTFLSGNSVYCSKIKMPKVLSDQQYHRVVNLKKDLKMSNIAIAELIGIKRQTVAEILKRNEQTNSPIPKIKGVKKRTKTAFGLRTPQDIKALRDASIASPYKTPKMLKEELQLGCSVSTVKRRLNEIHAGGRLESMRRFLTDETKLARYNFAKENSDYNWQRVVFSDEIRIECSANTMKYTRVSPARRFNPDYLRGKVNANKLCVTVWAGLTYQGLLDLVVIEDGRLTGPTYIRDILQPKILPHKVAHPNMVYVHDGASPHRSKCVTEWLQEKQIELLDWPIQSHDLTPMTKIWGILKAAVGEGHNPRRNQQEDLVKSIKRTWANLKTKKTQIKVLYNSTMKKLMERCVERQGEDVFAEL